MKTSKYNIFIKSDKNVGEYLLANSLTGAVFKLSWNEKVTLDEGKIYELPEERIEEYCSKGILINDDVDEKSRLVYFHNRDKYSSDTLSLTILLTRYCNFECTYCYEGGQKINQSLTDDMRERIYRFIQTMLNLHKDIPTSAMDYESARRFMAYLDSIKKDKIIIIVIHDQEIKYSCDKIIDFSA